MWRYPALFSYVTSRIVAGILLLVILVAQVTFLEYAVWPQSVEAAVVTIDATVSTDANSFYFGGSQTVFISDQIGYKFYRDSTGACVYSKTTNGGGGWGAAVIVDAQTDCASIAVWYDQWTPGDFGTAIHIATMETAANPDRLYYNQLDTVTDTRLLGTTPVVTSSNSGQGGTFVSGTNNVTIAKSVGGEIFMAISDASDSFVVYCGASCDTVGGWNEAGTAFMDRDNDWNVLMPLATGEMMLINRDISLNDLRSRIWNGTSWSLNWSVLDANAIENATYDNGMAATIDHASGDVVLAYAADNDNFTTLDHDIRTARFSGGAWTNTADIFTNIAARGLTLVAISIDTNTSNVYAAYVLQTTPNTATTGNIFYATSTLAMSSWSTATGPVNSTQGDFRGLDLNIMSDERIYVTWQDPAPDDIFGETIANIAPITKVYRRGTPTATVNGGTTNFYVGSTFSIQESVTSRNVTNIEISEIGTVDAATDITNIKLYYDLDTSLPYDCTSETYSGTESQFGSTDTNGFSGADGTASFFGTVGISPTQAMCVYAVVDVLDSANAGDTLAISIEDPLNDIIVSGGGTVSPNAPVRFTTTTTIQNDNLTQFHYHWRNDNGTEVSATSATGGVENTDLAAILPNTPRRIRFAVSNEGTLTSNATVFRLEYAEAAPTCTDAVGWTDVGATDDAWNMYDSATLTNGANTTNIAVASGGVSNENTTFLTPNGGVRDTTSQTGALTLSGTQYVELEYALIASTTATEGSTYCFRVTDAGTPLSTYIRYPSATIAADVTASTRGTHVGSLVVPSTLGYVGGQFVLRENTSSRTVDAITVTASGTVDAAADIANVRMYYDLDTSLPYDCASESYGGTEPQYGATDSDGFSGSNGSSTFSGTVTLTTTQTMCVYVVVDVGSGASNNETLQLYLANPAVDVVVSSGSVSPSTPRSISGAVVMSGSVLEQSGYHWRNNAGGEATSTSATLGIENSQLNEHPASTPIRLRLAVTNAGAAAAPAQSYTLEFGPRVTTCSAVSVWTAVEAANDDWDLFDSTFLSDGSDTTNIATGIGGITDPNTNFLTPNGGVRDVTATTSTLTLGATDFIELEYSLTSTHVTAYDAVYCFRIVSENGLLDTYTQYAEVRTAPKRDFLVQRGFVDVTGTGVTLTAGTDYTAPASTSTAFVRITNTHHTGAGRSNAGGGAQNADDFTARLSVTDLTSSFAITRPATAINNTRVFWEIIEFIGDTGADNEMVVRDVGTLSFSTTDTSLSGGTITSVVDNADVVVYVTGVTADNTGRNTLYATQVTAEWSTSTQQPVLTRGAAGATAIDVSYVVVEYTGINWQVQRVEHTYTAAGVAETEDIVPVNNLSRAFIHTQKRMGALGNVNNYGHEVWLSSMGAVSFELEPAATTPAQHTSVAWIVENLQTSTGRMKVQRTNGSTNGGTEPVTLPISIFTPIEATNNTSIFVTSRVIGANTTFPLPNVGARITSTSTYELWRSEASAEMTYRTEIVEWPVTGLAVRQNYYRFYADNNEITPADAWPPGPAALGENAPITQADEPVGEGDRVRLRMTLRVANASLPAGLYDFRLQYGLRVTSCSVVASWSDVDTAAGAGVWRGYAATGTTNGASLGANPPLPGELLLSVADRAGSLVEEGAAPANPYLVNSNEDVEYDWYIEQNGALAKNTYCFRMVRADGTPIDGYINYPQIRTAGYVPQTKAWRFYEDITNETPLTPLAAEEVTPIEIQNESVLALRVTVGERKNVDGFDVKFKLQYDESPAFTNPTDVVATSTCTATSTWCYTEGIALDNDGISTAVLSTTDTCVAGVGVGCGTHNTSATYVAGFDHAASTNAEFAFYLRHAAARAGAVYYFRLYDVGEATPVALTAGYNYPSVVAETPKLTFDIAGLPAGTSTAGVLTTVGTSPGTVAFGSLPLNTDVYGAHRITVTTNATEGYRLFAYARQPLLNVYGTAIPSISGTNALPTAWLTGCDAGATGCVGYHTTDATLSGVSPTRFAPLDSYAELPTSLAEVMYSPLPIVDTHDILYRVQVRAMQPAGDYETEIVYIVVPTY